MRRPAAAVLIAAAAVCGAGAGSAETPDTMSPAATLVRDPARAQMNYMLNCQGCHLSDGRGMEGKVPNMAGEVARFLAAAGGRSYLAQVPGVANAALSDEDLADVLNWTLTRFDPQNLPADFEPYTAEEMAEGRAAGLAVRAADVRADLLQALGGQTDGRD